MTKFCVDCKWANRHTSKFDDELGESWWCDNPKALFLQPVSLVTGTAPPPHKPSCESARRSYGTCGPDAKFFEPRSVGFGV